MKKRGYTALIFGILALGWAGVMFFFSGQSGTESSQLSSELTQMILGWFPRIGMSPAELEPVLRKLAHFGIFAVEGFLMGFSLIHLTGMIRGSAIAALLCAAMAAANEYHQTFSAGRSCETRDMLIDTCGALTGIAAAAVIAALIALAVRSMKRRSRPMNG